MNEHVVFDWDDPPVDPFCVCPDRELEFIPLWQTWTCSNCKRAIPRDEQPSR